MNILCDGIVETSIMVPGLVVILSELESEVLSAVECTCAGVDGDIEILKFEVGVGVGMESVVVPLF